LLARLASTLPGHDAVAKVDLVIHLLTACRASESVEVGGGGDLEVTQHGVHFVLQADKTFSDYWQTHGDPPSW